MTSYDEHIERTEEFINEMPKEIADEIKRDVKRHESDENFRESDKKLPEIDALLERRLNYLTIEVVSKAFHSGEMSEEDYRQTMRRLLF